jgi:hypothetical protein
MLRRRHIDSSLRHKLHRGCRRNTGLVRCEVICMWRSLPLFFAACMRRKRWISFEDGGKRKVLGDCPTEMAVGPGVET